MKLPKFVKSEVKARLPKPLVECKFEEGPMRIVNGIDPKEMARNIIQVGKGSSKFLQNLMNNVCPSCENPVDVEAFRDLGELGKFEDSGLCQKCLDKKNKEK